MLDTFLEYLLYQFPILVVIPIGLVMGLLKLRTNRKAGLTCLIAIGILVLKIIIMSLLYSALISKDTYEIQTSVFKVAALIDAILNTLIWVFVLISIQASKVSKTEIIQEPIIEEKKESTEEKEKK